MYLFHQEIEILPVAVVVGNGGILYWFLGNGYWVLDIGVSVSSGYIFTAGKIPKQVNWKVRMTKKSSDIVKRSNGKLCRSFE